MIIIFYLLICLLEFFSNGYAQAELSGKFIDPTRDFHGVITEVSKEMPKISNKKLSESQAKKSKDSPQPTELRVCQYKKFVTQKKAIKKEAPVVQKDPEKDSLLKKNIRDMHDKQELLTAKEYARTLGEKELTARYLERLIIKFSNDHALICPLRLELADLYFEQGDMKKASKLYEEYVKFYPGSEQRDYVDYKTILTRFYARLKPPLDQTKTRKALALANNYLDTITRSEKHYIQEVEKIRDACYQDLYKYELDIFHQYVTRGRLQAAAFKLRMIKEEFLTPMQKIDNAIEPRLIELEGMLAQKQGNDKLFNETLATLHTKFPQYETKLVATNINVTKSQKFSRKF